MAGSGFNVTYTFNDMKEIPYLLIGCYSDRCVVFIYNKKPIDVTTEGLSGIGGLGLLYKPNGDLYYYISEMTGSEDTWGVPDEPDGYIAIMDNPFPWRTVDIYGPAIDEKREYTIGQKCLISFDMLGPYNPDGVSITIKDNNGNSFMDYTTYHYVKSMDIEFTMPSTDLYIKVEYSGVVVT